MKIEDFNVRPHDFDTIILKDDDKELSIFGEFYLFDNQGELAIELDAVVDVDTGDAIENKPILNKIYQYILDHAQANGWDPEVLDNDYDEKWREDK